jgi:ATP synthase protein I
MPIDEGPSPMSVGIGWAARVSTLGLEFGLPAILGHVLDVKIGTNPVGLLVGMVLGFVVGMMHILRIAKDSSKPT